MKVPAILVSLALATIAVAQAPTLPECAKECADGFLTSGIGNCGGDVACICADSSFISDISCCLVGKCQPPDQSSAIVFASGVSLVPKRKPNISRLRTLNVVCSGY
ncbi:hypothetical protein B0T17DRAFT_302236 [Bombardia bombarda]|uniref:CFEM domain-containing protein n=1 Tax=Bombardia bombarda TaxID=252184 RepID=A0AA39WU99_9PEZI|nr:hypothetical protein B0T17DRAFT_302236 [Bombardia bombarda]